MARSLQSSRDTHSDRPPESACAAGPRHDHLDGRYADLIAIPGYNPGPVADGARSAAAGIGVTHMAVALPAMVNLGPYAYRVTVDKADWRALGKGMLKTHWGFTDNTTATIYLHPDANKALQRVTLLHEVLHAAAFAGGVLDTRKRREEAWVAMAAPPLMDALSRSPGLLEFLSDAGE